MIPHSISRGRVLVDVVGDEREGRGGEDEKIEREGKERRG
jgi:hypothetical protein